MLAGSQSVFSTDAGAQSLAELAQRLGDVDIHVSGPLPGTGGVEATEVAGEIEAEALDGCSDLIKGLQESGAKLQRRALRACVRDLQWSYDGGVLQTQFELDRGRYATALIRELVDYNDMASAS